MTPEAKSRLSKIIRGTQGSANAGLRGTLLKDLAEETERRYHMGIKQLSNAGLDEAHTAKRKRLEDWIAEQVRAESGKNKRSAEDFLIHVVRQAAYTLLNRIVILRLMEAMDLRAVPVVTGGWNSRGYRDFRQLAPALCRQQQDPTEGFSFLLQLVFEELAMDMPGLYGSAGIADLIPVPPETLRAVIEAFDDPELESCWTDDMTLGWVYQYWNDPDREALDAKINDGGKIEPHEIASKTQMFTERYMVDWLLQNSLGPMWLAMCGKHGWTPECESDGTLERLEQRRIEWRAKRDQRQAALASRSSLPERTSQPVATSDHAGSNERQSGDVERTGEPGQFELRSKVLPGREDLPEDQLPGVSLTALMPLHNDEERRWAYYVPQPIPDDAVEHAPDSVRDLKILDPAVGSGHFLVVAFDLLFALYQEEGRHRARSFNGKPQATVSLLTLGADASGLPLNEFDYTPKSITERILEHNLHGIDLDPRAVQIAAAALWLKAKRACAEAQPAQLNLVASNLRLSSLPDDDPALVELRRVVAEETGIPADLTNSIVHALSGSDYLGSLLKVDAAVDEAIRRHEETVRDAGDPRQRVLFDDKTPLGLNAIEPGTGSTTKPGVAAMRRTPGHVPNIAPNPERVPQQSLGSPQCGAPQDATTNAPNPDGVPQLPRVNDSRDVEPRWGSEQSGSVTWGAPETGAPRLCCETPLGLNAAAAPIRYGDAPDGTWKVPATLNTRDALKASVLDRLEEFLTRHSTGDDLGLRLRGEQLAAGVRFLRLVREGAYDLVVANPPYQGTSKLSASKYIEKEYPLGKADLFAAFLLRGLELVREGGVSSMLTMRNWMFIKQYSGLREHLLGMYDLRGLGDFAVGAFDDVPNDVLSVTVSVIHSARHRPENSVALQPTPPSDNSYDRARTSRKRAATLCQLGHHTFDPAALKVVPEWPLVYWWDEGFLERYGVASKLVERAPAKQGLATADNVRFLLRPWEVQGCSRVRNDWGHFRPTDGWQPFIKGGEGAVWFEPFRWLIRWRASGLELRNLELNGKPRAAIRNENLYFQRGIAFSMLGSVFNARLHRTPSIFDTMGSSVFPEAFSDTLCCLNSSRSLSVMASLNPTIHFQQGDVDRLPVFEILESQDITTRLDVVFSLHESHREPSVEFKHPGRSPWRHAQEWAQVAVDRPEGAPLPVYEPQLDPEPPTDHLSFALGVALGRFGANGEGILDPSWRAEGVSPPVQQRSPAPEESAGTQGTGGLTPTARREQVILPHGILFLDGTLGPNELTDGLAHPAAKPLLDAWTTHGTNIAPKSNLRDYLREKFFGDVHRQMYENRPIHWPLSSEKKTFVAWINIHRWNESTLRVLLADHLQPRLTQLEGELADLRSARDGADKSASKSAKDRLDDVQKWVKELQEFVRQVETCSDKGPPPTDAKCTPREVDARYMPDLDDGVMINSAALWPLLIPQWKDPKKWWTELANAKGKKDYDWSNLAMRYWPTRVDQKCQTDPSLGVAHGCFWKYHPARAWKWELRLQQEIGPEFRIEEAPYCPFSPSQGEKVPGGRMRGFAAQGVGVEDRGEEAPYVSGEANSQNHAFSSGDAQAPSSGLRPPSPPISGEKGQGDGGDVEHRANYLAANAEEALQTIETEALRRRKKLKQPHPSLTILDPGLWTAIPELCWAMELRVIVKQGGDFLLLSPDEPKARKAFEKSHSDHVAAKKRLLDKAANENLFAEQDDEEEGDGEVDTDTEDSDDN